jgi:hypothetical protein
MEGEGLEQKNENIIKRAGKKLEFPPNPGSVGELMSHGTSLVAVPVE